MRSLQIFPQTTPLSGTIGVPGDKSISHRAVMLAGLATGQSQIGGWLPAGDTLATLEAMRALGVEIQERPAETPFARHLTITGRGLNGLMAPAGTLDCCNAGTCIRLLAGVMAGQSFPSVLDGSEQLRRRPMRRITAPLRQMGANISDNEGKAPLAIVPAGLRGLEWQMAVASAQVKSAILLAGLYADGPSRIYEPGPARDHTERMLRAMGVAIDSQPNWVSLLSRPEQLAPLQLTIPGDMSSAAFPLLAAAIVPNSEISLTNIGLNPTRTGLLDILAAMGGQFEMSQVTETGGEPAGTITLGYGPLRPVTVGGEWVVRAIDEFPVWAVAASQANGDSLLRDAAELRVKEVDRIAILAGELGKMNIHLSERPDGFVVHGGSGRVQGATVHSHGDHRLAMALTVAGLVANSPTTITHADCLSDSFPGFVETMQHLGATLHWQSI